MESTAQTDQGTLRNTQEGWWHLSEADSRQLQEVSIDTYLSELIWDNHPLLSKQMVLLHTLLSAVFEALGKMEA